MTAAAGTGDPYIDPNPPPEETTSEHMDTTSTPELSDEKAQVSYVTHTSELCNTHQ